MEGAQHMLDIVIAACKLDHSLYCTELLYVHRRFESTVPIVLYVFLLPL